MSPVIDDPERLAALEARYEQAKTQARAAKVALRSAHETLEPLLAEIGDPGRRGIVNAMLWECAAQSEARRRYFSQYGQDAFLDEHVFEHRRDGIFVEIGGFDGVTGSNSLFFELFRGWSGLLIEPVTAYCNEANAFRRCPCENILIGPRAEKAEFLEIKTGPIQMSGLVRDYDSQRREWVEQQPSLDSRTVIRETVPLADVLRKHGLSKIDFVSLDVEGSELAILQAFPFGEFTIGAWSIETIGARDQIASLMRKNGFEWLETIGNDDIFTRL